MLLAGVFCGLSFLAKPTYIAMAVGICGLGVLRPWFAGPRRWPLFAAGFAVVVGAVFLAIAGTGLWDQFRHQAFGQLLQARAVSKRQLLFQDWPSWLFIHGYAALLPLAAVVLIPIARLWRWAAVPALALLAAVMAVFIAPAWPSSVLGIPTDGQMNLLVGALALMLLLNLIASAVTVAARLPRISQQPWAARVREEMFPPMVTIVAAVLEYLQGVDLSSMRFAYVGTFLGVPVALAFLYMGWRIWGGAPAARAAVPAVVGVFIAISGAVVTHGSPYLDGPRDQMTAGLGWTGYAPLTEAPSRVTGLKTLPDNAAHIKGLVAEIEQNTAPGESIFVFPDGQAYYVITGRTNPTKVDWYDVLATTPAMSSEAVADLQRNPPTWILVQEYNESDFRHQSPLDFESVAAWKPIYDYITSHYDLVTTVDGVRVYRLR
jgi:hypothetical protein